MTKAAYADEAEVGGGTRRRAPSRKSIKRNLDKKVTFRLQPKRGPKTASRTVQVMFRLNPRTNDALLDVEQELQAVDRGTDRDDVMRALLDARAELVGAGPIKPEVDPADEVAGRTEVMTLPMQPEVRQFVGRQMQEASWSIGALFEQVVSRAVQFDQMSQELDEANAKIAELEGK